MHLIKDEGVNYKIKNVGVEVKDLYSYLEARKLYKKYRESSESVEIVVKKKSLFSYFLDLEEDEKVTVEIKYPRVKLEVSIEEMKGLGIEDIDSFYDISEGNDTFDRDLLNYHFQDEENIINILGVLNKISYTNNKLLEIIERKYLTSYPIEMRKLFSQNPRIFREKLLEGFVFSKYTLVNYRILGLWTNPDEIYKFYNENEVIKAQLSEIILGEDLEYLENKIRENHKKLNFYLEYNESKYLRNISGYLKFEKEFYMENFLGGLNESNDIKTKKINYIEYLEKFKLNTKITTNTESKDTKDEVVKLLDRLESLNNIDFSFVTDPNLTLKRWKEFFKDEYIEFNNELEVNSTINLIKNCERKYKVDLGPLKSKVEAKWNYADNKFQEYFLKNYNQLMSSETKEGLSYKLEEVKKILQRGKKVFFLFIDCLRYDIWDSYKEEFQKKGYFVQNDDLALSMIPTVTNHCKKILFTGKKYDEINKDVSYVNGLEEYFLDYKINSFSSVEEIDENASINVYEVLEIDENIHNSKGLTSDYLKSILNHKLMSILNYLEDEDANIVLCSDHGFMSIDEDRKKKLTIRNFVKEKGLEIESHGRYMSISGSYFDENIYNMLMESLKEEKEYQVIKRNELGNYYLKESTKNKEIYCYILLKENYTLNTSNGCTHGGITMKEVMVPFAILEKKEKRYVPLKVEIVNSKVTTNESSEVMILLKNQNMIDELEISLKYSGGLKTLKNIDGNKQIPISIITKESGEIPDKVVLKAKIQGRLEIVEADIDIKSIESKASKMSKTMKKKRSIL